ncbi:MAG: class IV adenylate cyclase [Candidatus Paceibacterota bacterium]|jgi:adenylate cyclase class 2
MQENEVKFLNIDPVKTENRLKEIGAEKIFDKIYKRRVYDYPDLRLNEKGAYLRLRDEGDKITFTFKQRLGMKGHDGKANDEGMEEIEVNVSDFDKTAELVLKLGMIEKFYEENRRIRYKLRNIEFDIDFWPLLNPYLEIEAPTWEEVDEGIELLNLDQKDKKIFSTFQVYQLSGINELDYKILTLDKTVKK